MTINDDYALYLFHEGTNSFAYRLMGCHKAVEGYEFAVWAPNAASVSVVGDFNGWDARAHVMKRISKAGVWGIHIKEVHEGDLYKFAITGPNGETFLKADPYAFYSQLRPHTASIVHDLSGFSWTDGEWLKKRRRKDRYASPMCIYEVHLGSWRGSGLRNYRDLADELVPYLLEMNFTHIELLPLSEYPLDQSWGYQPTGYYSPTSRYGTPQDFMYFVNKCHENGIGVILDWVCAHFARDEHGLRRFDGTPLYEPADERRSNQPGWGTLLFDYGKREVQSFLISNAFYWFDVYHIDGLRADAVSSMLYLDYDRKEGQWRPNKFGGRENLEAVEFVKKLNTRCHEQFPDCMIIAEESSAWPGVTKPAEQGGLGFSYKWNMGYMNDTLKYFSEEPKYRKHHHDKLTFPMMYAFSEKYILPFSHDEVVHGKRSLLNRMPGDYAQKFDSLRLLLAYMYAFPGKKLLFMGSELAQFIEWRSDRELDWMLLDYDKHRQMKDFVSALNLFYRSRRELYEQDDGWDGFEWLCNDDRENSVIAFLRRDKKGHSILAAFNFRPKVHDCYRIPVPQEGTFIEVFNTDYGHFGGSSFTNPKPVKTDDCRIKNCDHSVALRLPPLGAVFMRFRPSKVKKEGVV